MLLNYKIFSKFYYFLLLLLLVTAGGTIGFMIIEEWNFIDSFYMTIITISTVGFREVNELSMYGKIFTSFLIISSFGIFAYAVTSITTYIISGEYRRYFREFLSIQETKRMKNHVIICGFGRVGKQVANDLEMHGHEFVIIENDDNVIEDAKVNHEYHFLKGNSTDDSVLSTAGVDKAKAIITCLPKDADNIYVVLAARECSGNILIVSRASYASAVSKLRMAGANNVIMPDTIGGSHMASLIASPDVMEFLDQIRVQDNTGANIESISFEELPSDLQNKTIRELEAREITGVTIVGYRDPEGNYIVNPSMETIVVPGSKLFVLGNTKQIQNLIDHFNLHH